MMNGQPNDDQTESKQWTPLRVWRWPASITEVVLAALLVVTLGTVGGVLIAAATTEYNTMSLLVATGKIGTGCVTGISYPSSGRYEDVTVKYKDSSGHTYSVVDMPGSDSLREGRCTKVLYAPGKPLDAEVYAKGLAQSRAFAVDGFIALSLLAATAWQILRLAMYVLRAKRSRASQPLGPQS